MRSTFFGVLWLCVVVVLEFSVVFFSFFDLTILLPIPNIPRGTPDSKLLEDLGKAGLRVLFAHKNKISQVPPAIGHLANVEILSLASNKITSLPSEIGGLNNLQELYLSGNAGLRSIPPSCQNWSKLRALYCQGCVKLKQLPLQLAFCQNLRDLNVLSGKKKQSCIVYQSILESVPGLRLRGGKVKKNKKGKGAIGGAPMIPK